VEEFNRLYNEWTQNGPNNKMFFQEFKRIQQGNLKIEEFFILFSEVLTNTCMVDLIGP